MDDMTSNSFTASASSTRSSRRRVKRVLLLIVVPLVAGLIGLAFYLKGGRYVSTDDAYLKADIVPVSAEVAGTVQEVLVKENQEVMKWTFMKLLEKDKVLGNILRKYLKKKR